MAYEGQQEVLGLRDKRYIRAFDRRPRVSSGETAELDAAEGTGRLGIADRGVAVEFLK